MGAPHDAHRALHAAETNADPLRRLRRAQRQLALTGDKPPQPVRQRQRLIRLPGQMYIAQRRQRRQQVQPAAETANLIGAELQLRFGILPAERHLLPQALKLLTRRHGDVKQRDPAPQQGEAPHRRTVRQAVDRQ